MPLTPITPKAPSREGTSTTLSYEFNHKTLSTLELPWHGHPYGSLLPYLFSPVWEYRFTPLVTTNMSNLIRHNI